MKYFMRMIASFLCLVFAVTLLSCAKPDISDPLAKNPDLMENVTNDWMPILEKEECLATMGMGNSEDTIHLSTNWRFANYGNCLYFWGYYTYKAESGAEMRKPMLMRYDLRTGETYPACRDSACLHRDESCPFFMGNINAYIMDKNIIYMLKCETKDGEVDTSKPGGIYSYNVDTMEYKLIAERETGATNYFGYHDKKLYYVQNEYKERCSN